MKARVLTAFSSPVYGELKPGDIIPNVRGQAADLWVKHGMIEDATKPAKKRPAKKPAAKKAASNKSGKGNKPSSSPAGQASRKKTAKK